MLVATNYIFHITEVFPPVPWRRLGRGSAAGSRWCATALRSHGPTEGEYADHLGPTQPRGGRRALCPGPGDHAVIDQQHPQRPELAVVDARGELEAEAVCPQVVGAAPPPDEQGAVQRTQDRNASHDGIGRGPAGSARGRHSGDHVPAGAEPAAELPMMLVEPPGGHG